MSGVIEARGLVKKYGEFTAVGGIDFSILAGEAFGFLGPNGAGKTSTLKMLSCVSPLTQGSLEVMGMDVSQEPRAIKARLGVVPQRENLDPDLTVWQNLLVYARYFALPPSLARERSREVLELLQLQDKTHSPIATLSEGLKRRLLIARALLNQPSILILDEPTASLDPEARLLVWQKLRYLQGQGTTLLLSTHDMAEAAHLCDRLVIMHLGKILAEGRPAELVERLVGPEVEEFRYSPEEMAYIRGQLNGHRLPGVTIGTTLYIFDQTAGGFPQEVLSRAQEKVRRPATLEDVFLKLTGRGLQG